MDRLSELRGEIDGLDEKLVALLAKRMAVSKTIGKAKKSLGLDAVDEARERQVLMQAIRLGEANGLHEEFVEGIFKQVLEESLAAQKSEQTIVAFQGEAGAFSEEAACAAFPGCVPVACKTFANALEAVERGEADYALLPIENSTEGIVGAVADLLVRTKLAAVGEVLLRVNLCLLALPGQRMEGIKEVYSHPQALAQAGSFLSTRLAQAAQIPFYDTAGAAQMIAQSRREGAAAIASKAAARHYGLEVIAEKIEARESNFTRFLAFARQPAKDAKREKTSIVAWLENKPGTLAGIVDTLSAKGINITRVESRPIKEKPWEYVFFVDFEADCQSGVGKQALEEMGKYARATKIIGSYAKAKFGGRT